MAFVNFQNFVYGYDFFAHLNNYSLLTCTFILFYFKQTLKIYKLQTSIILHISIPHPQKNKWKNRLQNNSNYFWTVKIVVSNIYIVNEKVLMLIITRALLKERNEKRFK